MTFTHSVASNNFGCAKWIVSANVYEGTHTTIATALTSASSGDTIFIRPGTYTENLTLKAGVNLTAYQCDSSFNSTGNVIISGNATLSSAGSVTISGIQLQTNSAAFLTVSGSNASIANLNNCFLNCSNNTGITFSAANTSAQINIENCRGNLGTTGIAYFSDSSTGKLLISNSFFSNTGNSVTASTKSAGILNIFFTYFPNSITYSSSSAVSGISNSNFDNSANNNTMLTTSGTGSIVVTNCYMASGTASTISVGTGTTVNISSSSLSSSNTNVITGAGAAILSDIAFSGTSHLTNVTTQTGGAAFGLTQGSAPSAGCIGENVTNNAGSVALTNNTAKTITSINLTAGVWDISGMCFHFFNGTNTSASVGISATNNTMPAGGAGQQFQTFLPFGSSASNAGIPLTLPAQRVVLSGSATYYLVGFVLFSTGTCSSNGYISATRVG